MRLSNLWLKQFQNSHDKEVFKQKYIASKDVLDALINILEEDLNSSVREMRKIDMYDSPSWPVAIADRIGEQRTYQKLIDFLKEK